VSSRKPKYVLMNHIWLVKWYASRRINNYCLPSEESSDLNGKSHTDCEMVTRVVPSPLRNDLHRNYSRSLFREFERQHVDLSNSVMNIIDIERLNSKVGSVS